MLDHDEEDEDDAPAAEHGFDTTSFLTGILVGAAVGAGIALIFAPATGEKTRRLIRGRARSLGKDASRTFASARDQAREVMLEKKEALRERLVLGLKKLEDELEG
jgi:gas vesicle protein